MRATFACCLLLSSAIATADDKGSAKHLYEVGMKHYNLTEWSEALASFREAYRLSPDPAFLYNIAQCHRQLHDPDQAKLFYMAYRRNETNIPPKLAEELDHLIAECDRAIAERRAQQPPTGTQAPREIPWAASPPTRKS